MMIGASVNHKGKALFPVTESSISEIDATEIIETRFGKIGLQKQNSFCFTNGLLGMPDKRDFFLTDFPNEKLRKFKLMQSLDDIALSFITLPLSLSNEIISTEDLSIACNELGLALDEAVILLMVSVHRTASKVTISVNARAPLFINATTRDAAQYVFMTEKYSVQHFIS